MAKKKPSLIDAVKSLPKRQHNRHYKDSLTPEQRVEYDALLNYLRSLSPSLRPSIHETLATMRKHMGTAPSYKTLHRDLIAEK